jgi:uridine phosphorylase
VELCANVLTTLQNAHQRVVAGITHSKDAYYLEKAALQLPAGQSEAGIQWETWREAGVLATDMETSTLYVLGGLRGIQVVSTLVVVGEDKNDALILKGLTDACMAVGTVLSKMRPQNSGDTTTRSANSLLGKIRTD